MDEITAKLARPWPRTADGYTADGGYHRPIWSPAGFLARGHRYVLACRCGHRAEAPLQRLVDGGSGDWPMHCFSGRWRCAACGGREIAAEAPDAAS